MIAPADLQTFEPPFGVTRTWIAIGESWFGPTRLPLIVIKGREPGPRVVAVGAQHGDEAFAVLGLLRLAEELDPESLSGEVWMIPCLNVHGYTHGARMSPFDHQDMNRVHPGNAEGTVTEQIAFVLCRHVIQGADLLIDLHGGSPENGDIAFARWADAPGKPSVRKIAEALPVKFLVGKGGKTLPGMLSGATAELGVPQLSIEACNPYTPARENATEMADFVRVSLLALGMLPGPTPESTKPPVRGTHTHRAHTGGAYEPLVDYGQHVEKGAMLGIVRSLNGVRVQEVTAEVSGTVSVMRAGIRVQPGETLCTLSYDEEG